MRPTGTIMRTSMLAPATGPARLVDLRRNIVVDRPRETKLESAGGAMPAVNGMYTTSP